MITAAIVVVLWLFGFAVWLLSFFFLVVCRRPISTLFPYTTLFRSIWARSDRRSVLLCRRRQHLEHRDRKSTRLNSSHRTISYAVFCLKKKTDHAPVILPPRHQAQATQAPSPAASHGTLNIAPCQSA